MKPYIILVGGIPASGKTTYARHIAGKLGIPFISKDAIKENLYEALLWDTSVRENSKLYGYASYKVLFHILDSLMQAGVSFVAESNFITAAMDALLPMVEQYGYRALTVLMDADLDVLCKRFNDRDKTDQRHPGLVMATTLTGFTDEEASLFRDFCVGDKIVVDTTDLASLDYTKADTDIIDFIGGRK